MKDVATGILIGIVVTVLVKYAWIRANEARPWRLVCAVFGHTLRVKQVFSRTSRRVECLKCGKTWAMNDSTKSFLPWDSDFEELYKILGHRILK